MSLIVVPLNDLPAESSPLCASLLEVATVCGLEANARTGEAGKAVEPIRILLRQAGPFDPDVLSGPAGACLRVPKGAEGPPDARESSWDELLLDTIGELLRRAGGTPSASPSLIVVPVIHIPEASTPKETSRQIDDLMTRARSLWSGLEHCVERLTSGGIGGDVPLSHAGLRVLPWVFAEPRLTADSIRILFQGPTGFGNQVLTPIVYGDRASDSTQHPFVGYGQARLVTDLLLLGALSADRDDLKQVIPEPNLAAGAGDRVLVMHSALFEYPLDDLIREGVLVRLGGGDIAKRMVPDMTRLGILSSQMKDEVDGALDTRLSGLSNLLEKEEIPKDEFAFGPAEKPREHAVPGAGECDFRILPRAMLKDAVSLDRKSEALHDRFMAIIDQASDGHLDAVMEASLDEAHKAVAEQTTEIEKALRATLGPADASPSSPQGLPGTARAVGRALAAMDLVGDRIERIGAKQATESIETPSDVEADAARLRDTWVDGEESLVQKAATLATPGSKALHALAVGVGLFLTTWIVFLFSAALEGQHWSTSLVGASVAAIAGIALVLFLHAQASARFTRQCKAYCDSMLSDANAIGARLVRIVNRRLRVIKSSATNDLVKSVRAARRRLTTEISGLGGLINDELAVRSVQKRIREDQDRAMPPATAGRFPVVLGSLPPVEVREDAFHNDLRVRIESCLTLTGLPDVITVEDHRAILSAAVSRAVREASAAVDHARDAAQKCLEGAVAYGCNPELLSIKDATAADKKRVVLAGDLVRERLDLQTAISKGGTLSALPDDRPASRAFPRERAVAVVVCSVGLTGATQAMPRPGTDRQPGAMPYAKRTTGGPA